MNPISKFLLGLQEIGSLIGRMLRGLSKKPRYFGEIVAQMDSIGVGSLAIVILTGFFTGGVLILQAYPTLQYYGAQSNAGQGVATSLIRELGPVLTALMVAGRVGSAISAELGSMVVSQQIDAMRALGTSPVRKLVTPRVIALIVTLPLLTVAGDMFGLFGGGIVALKHNWADAFGFHLLHRILERGIGHELGEAARDHGGFAAGHDATLARRAAIRRGNDEHDNRGCEDGGQTHRSGEHRWIPRD